ncbi:MAG: hypothetical protein P1V20_24275 [Verrucomicrobiales bacterium]|nr:hypothetical protein [Verrucomicrobiales bacterium]
MANLNEITGKRWFDQFRSNRHQLAPSPHSALILKLLLIIFCLGVPATKALAQSQVWILNPTRFPVTYKLSFARSSQNFTIPAGQRHEHTSREYPATFLVDLNVNLLGYPQVKRFRLTPGRTYYFHIQNNQLHLLKQPLHVPTSAPVIAPVTVKVLVYALGGRGRQAVYHSSVIVYNTTDPYINGREWSFWPQGRVTLSNAGYTAGGRVVNSRPAGTGNPIKTFDLNSQHNPQLAAAICNDVINRWNRMPYRAIDSNCNHFVNDMMVSLGVGRHPLQYQNSWGGGVPLSQIQSTFENHYGVQCEHGHNHPGHKGHNGHNRPGPQHPGGHVPGTVPPPTHVNPQTIDKDEILRRILRRIGL